MRDGTPPCKTVAESTVELSQLMRPQHGNFAGNVHGGTMLALMDEAAYTCASRFAASYCVTAAVDLVEFLEPVRVGDVVKLSATVARVGTTSMDVEITVKAEDPRCPGSERQTNRCFFTMVAVDADGLPCRVPRLQLLSEPDHERACEAELRRRLRRQYHEDLQVGVCQVGAVHSRFSSSAVT